MGLTEMMFPYNLENIDDATEAMFDIMIPTHLNVRPKDPNIYERGRLDVSRNSSRIIGLSPGMSQDDLPRLRDYINL